MSNMERAWCPISKDKCNENCAWLVVTYDIDEDGIARYEHCAMNLLSCTLCELNQNILEMSCIEE